MKERTCKERITRHLKSRSNDFKTIMNAEDYENVNDEIGNFYHYGLDFGYVEPNTFKDQETGYYRYQLSWGGPSDEINFYADGTIEYWFKDWFDGAKKDITNESWAIWLKDWFEVDSSLNGQKGIK
jgi:hypothetical protein